MKNHRTENIKHKTKKSKNLLSVICYMLYGKMGFTLIELVVVIAIISILSTIGVNSFTATQRRSRDAKRKSDIKEVQTALEQYYSVCNYVYPTMTGDSYGNSINCPTPPITILPKVPVDPQTTTPYPCATATSNCDPSRYWICAILETETTNFCVTNLQ